MCYDILTWDSKRKLSWEDFKGNVEEQIPHAAKTLLRLTFSYDSDYTERTTRTRATIKEVIVKANFNKTKSWVKKDRITNKSVSQQLLDHEQGHFDLAYEFSIYAKETLEKKFLNTSYTFVSKNKEKKEKDEQKQARKLTKQLEKDLMKKHDLMQKKYEKDTDHGKITSKQNEYDERFAKLRK